jgi:hypothetical protein
MAITTLNGINQVIFVTEKHCVSSEVGTEFLNITKKLFLPESVIKINFFLFVSEPDNVFL